MPCLKLKVQSYDSEDFLSKHLNVRGKYGFVLVQLTSEETEERPRLTSFIPSITHLLLRLPGRSYFRSEVLETKTLILDVMEQKQQERLSVEVIEVGSEERLMNEMLRQLCFRYP